MKSHFLVSVVLIALLGVYPLHAKKSFKIDPLKTMTRSALTDKIKGGWAAKMIGVAYGLSNQFKAQGQIYGSVPKWHPEQVAEAMKQPDLYVQMTFLRVLEKGGLNISAQQFGDAFKDTKYDLGHANAAARRNLNREMIAPWSGSLLYNAHTDDNDFQSEADFIGLMCPNLPMAADTYAIRVGRVMNFGDGVFGGMWLCGMYSAAFFETDPRQIIEAGLKRIPEQSKYTHVIQDVLAWHKETPNDWTNCWQKLESKWGKTDLCPEGVLSPMNHDAKLNGGYIALGLLYGNGDFNKALEITTRAGQDSKSNAGNVAGILGVILGYQNLSDQWKAGIPKLSNATFLDSDYTLDRIVQITEKRALALIADAGGKVTLTEVAIPSLKRTPLILNGKNEEFAGFDGVPERRIPCGDPAWTWKGDWVHDKEGAASADSQHEAILKFAGTGIIVTGPLSQEGGRADVYLDGEPHFFSLDSYIEKNTHDNVLWHAFGLTNGVHTLRIVPRAGADPRSTGKVVTLSEAIIYR